MLSSLPPPLYRGGGWGEAFAVGVELRRTGPTAVASRTYCIVEPPPVLCGGAGEKCLQLQVPATRARCGLGRGGVTRKLEHARACWVCAVSRGGLWDSHHGAVREVWSRTHSGMRTARQPLL